VKGSPARSTPGRARSPSSVQEYHGPLAQWRQLVHRFADDVVMQFTGVPGVASTRIAFIVEEGRNKELWVMDADGANVPGADARRHHRAGAGVVARTARCCCSRPTGRHGPAAVGARAGAATGVPALGAARAQHQRGLCAGRPQHRLHSEPGRERRDLPPGRARRLAAAAHEPARHRHLAVLVAHRARHRIHLRPFRHAAGARHGCRRRQRTAFDVGCQLYGFSAWSPKGDRSPS